MSVRKVDASELLGGKSRIMFGDQIPPGWVNGLTQAADRETVSGEATMITLVLDAALFAAQKHSGQRRKDADASPYINHPLTLAHILATTGGVSEPAVLCAALLHDTVEDTQTTFEELELKFGPEITAIVREVTDDKSLEKAERKQRQVDGASKKSREAKLVKLADKISNLSDILGSPPADWSGERKFEYFEWASQVIDGLRGTNAALESEFDRLLGQGRAQFGRTPRSDSTET